MSIVSFLFPRTTWDSLVGSGNIRMRLTQLSLKSFQPIVLDVHCFKLLAIAASSLAWLLQLGADNCMCRSADWVLKGYVQGKRDAEARLAQLFPNSGVALRPGFIHGTRNVAGIPVPLQIVGEVPLLLTLR